VLSATAEEPGIQFSPLRIESGQEGNAVGWKVTAPVLTDGLVGRVCEVRFRLEQGAKRWDESRKRAIQVPQWEETAFYPRSSLSEHFSAGEPIRITFTVIDLVNQRELGSTTGSFQLDESLVIESARVIHFGKLVYQGRVDLAPTWERVQQGERGKPFSNGKLPRRGKSYWREFVHPTDGIRGDGPQRLILGKGGEIFYTPDYHKTFLRLR
jgi:filamentous hemagglutinin